MRVLAHLISVIFHPLFIPIYALVVLIQANPGTYQFLEVDPYLSLIRVTFNLVLLPGITMLVMRGLGFIKSFQLEGRMERILPYVAGLFFYIWTTVLFFKQDWVPLTFVALLLGAVIALILAFLANVLVTKVSMHTVAMGVVIGYFLALFPSMERDITLVIVFIVILAGLVGTSRLLLRAHDQEDIYMGYFLGMLGQLAAFYFI